MTDPSGAVIAGAKVTVKNEDTGLTRVRDHDSEGIYSFAELPVGTYRVEVESAGFKSAARSRITLNVADTRAVDVQLETGDVTRGRERRGGRGRGEDGRRPTISGVVTGEQARELPLNGRNFMQLTLLQPGVVGARRA